MTHEELLREFASLPPEIQRQVADYIAFLRERYDRELPPQEPETFTPMHVGFVGMWRDRDDMQDSSWWVRAGRVREWVKQSG